MVKGVGFEPVGSWDESGKSFAVFQRNKAVGAAYDQQQGRARFLNAGSDLKTIASPRYNPDRQPGRGILDRTRKTGKRRDENQSANGP